MKVAILGPVFPYKGGIAHYTSLLAKELAKRHKVKVFSFKLQYPRFLYPGVQQKDYDNDHFKIDGTKYILNSVNPLSWVRTGIAVSRFSPDLVIIPWWNPFFGPAFFSVATLLKWFGNTKILFISHNVLPHERLPLDRLIARATLNRGDFHIVQSSEDEVRLLDFVKTPHYRKSCHPIYDTFRTEDIPKEMAREKLTLPRHAKIILFFGFVRKYKGLRFLLDALPTVRDRIPEIKLLIAGDFYDDKQSYLDRIEELGIGDIVHVHDTYIPDREVGTFFFASDLVVLPYTSATQSGIVQIAYGFNRPVVVTAVGGLPEVVRDGKTGYVVPPEDTKELADAISLYFEEGKEFEFTKNIDDQKEIFSWASLVENIENMVNQE